MIRQGISGKETGSFEQFLKNNNINLYATSLQVHGKEIFIAENVTSSLSLEKYDGFITNQAGLTLIVKSADCVPLLFQDPVKRVIAAIHAGRKGTELKIAKETVRIFKEKYNSNPQDIICNIGPSICVNCYQIDQEQDIHFDLWSENKKQLLEAGLEEQNITISNICTACTGNDRYYSYRKDKTAKRNYSWIEIIN